MNSDEKEDKRHGHPENRRYLQHDIDEGKKEFFSIVEIIRIAHIDSKGRLINDFIKFRDIIAHKGVANMRLLQMVTAFLMYCREKLKRNKVSYSPASTKNMPKDFARMADINVVICATWFFNLWKQQKITVDRIVYTLNKYVKNSTFDGFHFEDKNGRIDVSYDDNKERLDEKNFGIKWLRDLTKKVIESPVTYTDDEVKEFIDCFAEAEEIKKATVSNSEDEKNELIKLCDDVKKYIESSELKISRIMLKKNPSFENYSDGEEIEIKSAYDNIEKELQNWCNKAKKIIESSIYYSEDKVKDFEKCIDEVYCIIEMKIYSYNDVQKSIEYIDEAKQLIK